MKKYLFIFALLIYSNQIFGQVYERNRICGSDTIKVDFISLKTGNRTQYNAFECEEVSKFGIRVDFGFNHYKYNENTRNWLGNHNGPLWGLTLAYGNFNFGAKFKPATVTPQQNLEFNGQQLTSKANLNPIKIEYDFSYSFNFKHNISIEPYIALTRSSFLVINEQVLGEDYTIKKVQGLTVGTSINKYFHLKDYQFFAVFAKYGYGFTNFKLVNSNLGYGYSDLSIGIAYKGFFKQRFLKRF